MHSQPYMLNQVLLEIRSSFIISSTFYLRFWFMLGSILATGSIVGFWTLTLAPRPGSIQVETWKAIAQFKSPLYEQLSTDYIQALDTGDTYQSDILGNIIYGVTQGHEGVAKLYLLEKQNRRKALEEAFYRRLQKNVRVAFMVFMFNPVCFMLGFFLLRKYLRLNGYTFQGRLLFFRVATPSVFKLAAILCWGYGGFLSYQIWTPSYWSAPQIKVSIFPLQESSSLPILSRAQLEVLNLQHMKEILQEHWIQSLLFYGFCGGAFWGLGRRWSQLPIKILGFR